MAGTVRAVFLGEDYQHRYFWIEASRLFLESPVVQRVALELPVIRAFDDVVTSYAVNRTDAHGRQIEADHFQLKFHVDFAREITGLDLISPAFIHAKRYSMLEHIGLATRSGDIPKRLTLVTPWRVSNSDPLRLLISPNNGETNIDRLFEGGPGGEMGKLREAWRQHLGGISDEELRRILRHLRIWDGETLPRLDQLLQAYLGQVGLELVDESRLDDTYIGISRAFIKARTHEHDATSLEPILRKHALWRGRPVIYGPHPTELAIRSFPRQSFELEDIARLLDLVPFFHGRDTIAGVEWDRDLALRIRGFLDTQVKTGTYDIHFDAHLSIGYLAGYLLGKTDSDVAPVQRQGRVVWRPTGAEVAGPLWEAAREISLGEGPDLAVAIEVTRAVSDDVALYTKAAAPSVGRVLVLTVAGGPDQRAVRDGDHADALARDLVRIIERERTTDERGQPLHLFAAGQTP